MLVILSFQVKARESRARFTKTNFLQLCGVLMMIYDWLAQPSFFERGSGGCASVFIPVKHPIWWTP
jgi:hypothetical protein